MSEKNSVVWAIHEAGGYRMWSRADGWSAGLSHDMLFSAAEKRRQRLPKGGEWTRLGARAFIEVAIRRHEEAVERDKHRRPLMPRRERAVQIRDLALLIMRDRAAADFWQTISGQQFRMLEADDLRITLRTPFQRMPAAPPAAPLLTGLARCDHVSFPHGLDIWHKRKVFNVEWSDDGRLDVVSYRPGEWESMLAGIERGERGAHQGQARRRAVLRRTR
jgi:hypothetical protein